MALETGTRLGPYEVLSPLSAGGMGEVYLAKDTTLERQVPIKVLPSEVASRPQRLQRFEQEAKTVALINHPSIVTVEMREAVIDVSVWYLICCSRTTS